MKNFTPHLILQLSLQISVTSLVAAEIPTFTSRDPKEYIGKKKNVSNVEPDGVHIDTTDGLRLAWGTEKSLEITDVVKIKCGDSSSDECSKAMKDVLGVRPKTDGIQRRFIGMALLGVGLACIVYKSFAGAVDILEDLQREITTISLDLTPEEVEYVDNWELDEQRFYWKDFSGNVSKVPIDVEVDTAETNVAGDPYGAGEIPIPADLMKEIKDISNDNATCENSKRSATNVCTSLKKLVRVAMQWYRETLPGGRLDRLQAGFQNGDIAAHIASAPPLLVIELTEDADTEKISYYWKVSNDKQREQMRKDMIQLTSGMA